MIDVYGLKSCDTCRKALKVLPEARLKDVRAESVPPDILERAFAQFGNALLNTRSATWRGLEAGARSGAPLELIAEHPALMKRPLIHAGDALFLGWSAETEADVRAAL
jgi:arsenate reductase